MRAEGVADLGAIERDTHCALVDGTVVRDVVERFDLFPAIRVEQL